MNTRINASTTSVTFNYDLGCATSSTLSVTSSDSWITRIVVNPNTFVVYVDANEAANDRSATLQISIDGVPCSGKEIILTQLGDSGGGDECTYTYTLDLLPTAVTIDSSGNTKTITANGTRLCNGETDNTFTPRYNWTKPSGTDWLTLANTQSATVTASANKNCEADNVVLLTCHLMDNNIEKMNKQVRVFQAGEECEEPDTCGCESITVTLIENNLSYTSGNNVTLASADVGVDCINRFSFTSDSNFISNIRISNGNVVGNITENSSENDRTATITVKFDTNSACTTFTITQEGRDEPEEHNPFFKVDFIHLNGGSWSYDELRNNGGINDGAPFIVSSSTWNGSSYQWANVTITIDDADYAQYITFDSGTPISGNDAAKTFRMFFKDSMPNKTKNGIHVTVKQNSTDLSSGATFNVHHVDDILYNDIRPYVVRISYEKPSTQSPLGVPERYGYYLHFKSYGDTNPFNGNYTTNEPIAVNNKVTFFANDNNCFTTSIDGSDCGGKLCGHPQEQSNKPYINANESDTLVYDANPITYANNIKNGLFLRNATEACVGDGSGFKYSYSETDIDFLGATSGSAIMQGYKSGESSVDSYYDGVRSVYLKIPNQSELEIAEGPHVLKASQVTFDDGDSGPVTVSVYEDGVAFVDSAQTSVATINECFQNITQFVNTVYPSGYNNEIQSCTMFNFVDLDGHCINDIVIENGELVKRDDTTPSSTIAMHIELDEAPSSTQAIHIEEENN